MKILVTNDDGIWSQGIGKLVAALATVSEIYVVAPNTQKSACGHGITVHEPIEVEVVDFPKAKLAYSMSGTPADCVKLGLRILKEQGIEIDYVFSGINHGSNLGTDTLYSGTVSGAVEGVINAIPSFAVSVNSHNPVHFDPACELALEALELAKGKIDKRTVISINLPHLPKEEIKGKKVTRLGAREYDEAFIAEKISDTKTLYTYSGSPVVYNGLPEDIDVIAVQDGYSSITPLHYDLTDYDLVGEVKAWGFEDFDK